MNPNSAPFEMLWTAIGMSGLAITVFCYHYADLDRHRILSVPLMNGVLDRVAVETLEREITRFVLFMMITLVGIVALYQPPNSNPDKGVIVLLGAVMLVGMEVLMIVAAVRTLRFRAWLLRQKS